MRIEEDGVLLTPPEAVHIESLTSLTDDGIWQVVRLACIEWVDSAVATEEPLSISYERRYLGRWLLARTNWSEEDGHTIKTVLTEDQLHSLSNLISESITYNQNMISNMDAYMAGQERQVLELAGDEEIPGLTDITDEEREGLKSELRKTALSDLELEVQIAQTLQAHFQGKP